MQKRYDDLLTTRLEEVDDLGCAKVLWSEIYRWYETKRVAAKTYRDINERWQELTGGERGQLQRITFDGGMVLLAEQDIEPLSSTTEE